MAKGINKVILVGNCGGDPETKYTQGGQAVTKVSVATTEKYKNREDQWVEKTAWHSVVFFGKLAEIAGEYLRKGSQVYVEGKINYRDFTGDDGVKKYYTDIICNEMQMLGGKPEGGRDDRRDERPARQAPAGNRSSAPGRDVPGRTPPQQHAGARRETAPATRDFGDDFADDDIPF